MFRMARCRWWAGAVAGLVGVAGLLSEPLLSGGEPRSFSGVSGRAARVEFEDSILLVDEVDSTGRQQKRSWGSEQVEGPPDVRQAGDNVSAWASVTTDGQREWLLCSYAAPVQVRAVMVYATYNPGALAQVNVLNEAGDEVVAWEGEDPTPRGKPRGVSVIPVKVDFPVQTIRVTLDSPAVPGWNEIDAIGIEDTAGAMHWATAVEASSVYGTNSTPVSPANSKRAYSPEQATGEPDTAGPGDQAPAWASASPDNQPEWLVCEYKKPEIPAEIVVYANNAPGAITKVSVIQEGDKEVTVFEGEDPTPRGQPWGVSVFPVTVDFPFSKVKLYINSQEVPGYNEIDAVGLRASNGDIQWASSADASSSFGAPRPEAMERPRMTPPANDNPDFQDLQKEVQALRQQVEELKQFRDDLKELKDLLKDKVQ